MTQQNAADKTTSIAIFGASGDLTQRKLIPALFNLFRKGRLPAKFLIVGVARTRMDDEAFRTSLHDGVKQYAAYQFTDGEWEAFASHLSYHACDFTADGQAEGLAQVLSQMEQGPADRLYYLATPPKFFAPIAAALGRAGMVHEADGFRRVIIEKPFGTDLTSARELTGQLHQVMDERQIYRIDHYLGKETVQNMLVFRFANGIFEPIWNRNYVDHVEISVLEQIGVEHRAGYYDGVGLVRDMFQNHILALLALVAMEPPASLDATALRNERAKVLSAVRPIPRERLKRETVRGQYAGYRQEEGVAPDSQTPTFAAMRLYVDNWRWQGVPFFLRSGKKLKEKRTEIIIQFRRPPHVMFPESDRESMPANVLSLCLMPQEGIHLRFDAKVPDTVAGTRPVDMDFTYADTFGPRSIPEAYERLVLDALHGDQSLFNRNDQVELAWQLLDPVISGWDTPDGPPLAMYQPGTWGPPEAVELMAQEGRDWLLGGCVKDTTTGAAEK
jgi:glucose-6-phosphate 1-dehydrogenase